MNKILIMLMGLLMPLHTSLAIPPPDLIISGLQSVVQVLGMVVAFLVSLFFLLKDQLKLWWQGYRHWVIFASLMAMVLLVYGIYWFLSY